MPFNISNLPAGLASLLNLQQQGRGPNLLAEQIVPTLPLFAFFAANRYESIEDSRVAAQGGSNAFVVPAGELWFVHSLSARLNQNVQAGESIRVAPAFALKAQVVLTPLASLATFTPGETAQWGSPGGFLVTAGGILGSYVAQVTGAYTIVSTVVIARLRI